MPRPRYKSIIDMDRPGYWWVDNKYWSKTLPKKFKSCCTHRGFRTLNRADKAFDAIESNVRMVIAYRKAGKYYIKWEAKK